MSFSTCTNTMDTNEIWSGWIAMGGITDYNPSLAAFNNKLYGSVRGIGTSHNTFIANTTGTVWTAWTPVPIFSTTGPAIAVFNNKLYAMVASTNNYIYVNNMDMNEAWVGWTSIGGQTDMNPSLAVFNNRLYASIRGTGGNHSSFINSMDTNGLWRGWASLSIDSTSGPAIAAFNGKLYAMVASTNNYIYVNSMDTSEAWSGWVSIGGQTDMTPSLSVFNNRLYASLRGIGGNKYTFISSMDTNGTWTSWALASSIYSTTGPAIAVYNGKIYAMVNGIIGNLLINPGFEYGISAPDGWWIYGDTSFTLTWETTGRGAGRCISISHSAVQNGYGGWGQSLASVDPTKTYTLSGYIKTENVSSGNDGAHISVDWYDQFGGYINSSFPFTAQQGTQDWTSYGVNLAPGIPGGVPTNAAKANVICQINYNSGKAYFDDVSLSEAVISCSLPTIAMTI